MTAQADAVPTEALATEAPAAEARRRLPTFFGFVLAVGLVWLGGQFVRQGVSDSFLTDKPGLAVLWQGDSSEAIAALARASLKAKNPGGAARLAVKAMQRWPLNAPALTTYGLALEQLKQPARANLAMTLAGRAGWRDNLTQIWLFRRDMLAQHYPGAVDHGDALLRRQEQGPVIVYEILAAVAARDPRILAPLSAHLAAKPAWREPFFETLTLRLRPPPLDAVHALLASLVHSPAPPTDEELQIYLGSLVAQQKFQQAEADWRQLAPGSPRQTGGVYDGGFEQPPGPSPFDWQMGDGVGWTASIEDAPGAGAHGKALKLEYDGVSPSQPLAQLVTLPPGTYQLAGRAYDDGGSGDKSLFWTLACPGSPDSLARVSAPPGTPEQWRAFSVTFTVPASGCAAQLLRLSADPGGLPGDVVVWFDDMAISATSAVAPKPQAPGAGPAGIR
ncbi:MAG TPA: hypothetical protein VGG29_18960 [Caulobacteraceae bacterium]